MTGLSEFRHEVRSWIAANRLDGLEHLEPLPDSVLHPNSPYAPSSLLTEWTERLRAGRWLCVAWPEEYGGRGLTAGQVIAMNDEFAAARVPRLTLGLAEGIVGPAVILFGTDEQKAHFLPRIVSGQDIYCEGYSEPGAGSDLASLTTRGDIDGDRVVITGQKVWTSDSAASNMVFVLCRTDQDAPKHRGLSFVLTQLHDNHIEIRPIKQMNGKADFAEVFYDGATAPLFNVIGGLGRGWDVVMGVRGSGIQASGGGRGYGNHFHELVELARRRGLTSNPVVRDQLAAMFIQTEVRRLDALRTLARVEAGHEPGPGGSVAKFGGSEVNAALMNLAMNTIGPDGMIADADAENWQQLWYQSRALLIGGGTSEIHRNIAAERVLGLPKG